MSEIILTCGIPASGKSTWAKEVVTRDSMHWRRINFDDLRESINAGVYSREHENLIIKLRDIVIAESVKQNVNVIVDNTHIKDKGKHFAHICSLVEALNLDVYITEKPFYIDLNTAIERDSKRENPVGERVITKFWHDAGGKLFRHYKPRTATFSKQENPAIVQDETLPRCLVCDNDGTLSLLNGRNPYNATTCDQDLPHKHVIECVKLYHKAGYKIIFVSGREDKYKKPTEEFYKKYLPEVEYELYMRPTGNTEKDVLIKERIFNNYIKKKYFVAAWLDDRLQIAKWLHSVGLPLFRVNDPEADF